MRVDDINAGVQEFFARHACGRVAEDAFPAWWLHHEFDLSPADAATRTSSGSHDHGIDAFHVIDAAGSPPTLHLVQAKYTASRQQIRDGIRGLGRAFSRLADVLRGEALVDRENTIWTRLRARLQDRDLSQLVIHARVLHLAEADEDVLLAEARAERLNFEEQAAAHLPDHAVRLSLTGPTAVGAPRVAVNPTGVRTLRFDGVEAASGQQRLFIGLGRLADLVKIYEETGDVLFAKNVRAFNYRAAERGPAHHLRETLRRVCIGSEGARVDPLHFTLFHNGITVHATSAERADGTLKVRSPGVLNGCQTVKSAWLFRNDKTLRAKIDPAAWDSILVPVRVVRTTDEALVRSVTVSNNRQTSIRPSGFRANDELQLQLSERLRYAKIFYERQQDAFVNLRRSSPKALETEYSNSFDGPLQMEELAQAIASVSHGIPLSVASKTGDLFESPLYERVFSPSHLRSVSLLVFITNVLRSAHLALKDVREKSQRLAFMVPSRFRYLATRIIVRWAVKKAPELVEEFGDVVIHRPNPRHRFRERLRKLLAPANIGFQTALPDVWTQDEFGGWTSATDKELSEKLLRDLRLQDVDVFERYVE